MSKDKPRRIADSVAPWRRLESRRDVEDWIPERRGVLGEFHRRMEPAPTPFDVGRAAG
jgi:hypothetical protein